MALLWCSIYTTLREKAKKLCEVSNKRRSMQCEEAKIRRTKIRRREDNKKRKTKIRRSEDFKFELLIFASLLHIFVSSFFASSFFASSYLLIFSSLLREEWRRSEVLWRPYIVDYFYTLSSARLGPLL